MKKSILSGAFAIICLTSFTAKAGDDDKKHTIEIQGKGLANATFLFNKNISDAGGSQDYAAGWGYNYGLGLSMYFGNVGFGIEGLYGQHQGAYAGNLDIKDASGTVIGTKSYTSHINLSVTQIPVFLKLKNEVGAYLEVGPQYNLVSAANYNYSDDSNISKDTLLTKNYASSYFSVALGVGFKVPIKKTRLSILCGLRFQYSLSDLKGVDGLGNAFINPFSYKAPEKTSAATGGLVIGVVYTLGEKKKDK